MKLRDRMIYAGIVMSDLKRRHQPHIREFYRDLLHVCDDCGRFEANVRDLRSVLFAPILNRVSERDVQGYLQALHVAGDIKLYTVRGRGFGKVTKWRQLRLKRKVAEYPDEDGEIELPLGEPGAVESGPSPPAPPLKKEGRKEGSVSRKRERPAEPPAHTQPDKALAEDCLPELMRLWPEHDVRAALRGALRYVRAERGAEARVEFEWFNDHWMPNEPKDRAREDAGLAQSKPVNFERWFAGHYEKDFTGSWEELKPEAQAYYLKMMGAAAEWAVGAEGAA